MKEKIVTTIRMPFTVKEKLQKASQKIGISVNEIILIAINAYLEEVFR